jgi:3',5'-cyclic AMP phosphodiesterase CpdA
MDILLPKAPGPVRRSFTFAQVCDVQLGMAGYAHDVASFMQCVAELNQLRPDFVLFCGDMAHETEDEGAFIHFNRLRAGLTMPSYCVPGNHDLGNEPTAELLARYRRLFGADRYAFDHKGMRFVMVNTQLWKSPLRGETQAQEEWIKGVLFESAEAGLPACVVGHFPLFTHNANEDEYYFNLPLGRREDLYKLYRDHGVRACISGHTHRNLCIGGDGPALVSSASTSHNYDSAPLGYRLWRVAAAALDHEYFGMAREPLAMPAPAPAA